MILEILNDQEKCTVDDFSREIISINVQGTVLMVLKN